MNLGRIGAITAGCLLILCSCARLPDASRSQGPADADISPPLLTAPQRAYVEQLRQRGGLRLATVAYTGGYEADHDGSVAGFHYELGRELADFMGVEAVFSVVDFDQFFSTSESDDSVAGATPDIFDSVDVLAYDLTILPPRERLMRMIPLMPTRVLTVSLRGNEVHYLAELQGKRVALFRGTSHEYMLQRMSRRLGIPIELISLPFGADRIDLLEKGEADLTVGDSSGILRLMSEKEGINASLALGEVQMFGWGVERDNAVLAEIVAAWFEYAFRSGTADRLWRETYGMSLEDYSALIGYPPREELLLSPAEEEYLRNLREAGGLRVAIDREQSIYEPRSDGTAGGLHYALLLEVAELLDLSLTLEPLAFERFFTAQNGDLERMKEDPGYSYTPELLERDHLYVATMSPLE